MEENGLCVDGFSKEITMIDDGFTGDADKFVTEIQIPVRPGNRRGDRRMKIPALNDFVRYPSEIL